MPGFDLDVGFEFKIDPWNIFDLMITLRQILVPSQTPYRIARPQETIEHFTEKEEHNRLQKKIDFYLRQGEWKSAVRNLDKCLCIRTFPKGPFLKKRHHAVTSAPDCYLTRCWHHKHLDEYWTSNIEEFESEAEGEMTVKRLKRVSFTCSENGLDRLKYWQADEVLGHDGFDPYGYSAISEKQAVFILQGRFSNIGKETVALIERREPWNAKVLWEFPLFRRTLNRVGYDAVAIVGKSLIRLVKANTIAFHDIETGSVKRSVSFDVPVSVLRRVVFHGRDCAALGTESNGTIYVFNDSGSTETELRISDSTDACIHDISHFMDAIIFSNRVDRFIHFNVHSGEETNIWSRWDYSFPDSLWANPEKLRLTACGRAVAYLLGSHLNVFDVFSRKLLLHWAFLRKHSVPPCFDISGRWLTFAHSYNKTEIFELMWDIP